MSIVKDIVKGLCEKTKCYFDVYTKHYIDNNIYTKENIDNQINQHLMANWAGGEPLTGTDANTLTKSGTYYLGQNCSNLPTNAYVRLLVSGLAELNMGWDIMQIAMDMSSGEVYTRNKVKDVWHSWKKISLDGHHHDSRYYTESEVNNLLNNKSNTDHHHDDRYYTEWEVNNLLANYKVKGDFAVITGTVKDDVTINYPSGFNKNNCVPVSIVFDGPGMLSDWCTGALFNSAGYVNGALPYSIIFSDNHIQILRKNINLLSEEHPYIAETIEGSSNYKLVLMKV